MKTILIISLIVFLLWLIKYIYEYILYSQPLSEEEIEGLAYLRRLKAINQYYSFDRNQFYGDKVFKKNMDATGSFYNVDIELFCLPATIASWLKGKKHEWIIVAFEKGKKVDLIWMNKGFDNEEVCIFLDDVQIKTIALDHQYNSILIFHNHPNGVLSASNQDYIHARTYAQFLNDINVNLIDFVCATGVYHEYSRFVVDSFMCKDKFIAKIQKENDISTANNISLHKEFLTGL